MLYRYHRIGQALETRLIEAGIPCLMARGQALMDDELIGFIVASLRIILTPRTIRSSVEAFAEQVLPRPLLDRVRASHRGLELLTALRAFARTSRGDPGRAAGVALHLPHREPGGAGPHARRARALVDALLAAAAGPRTAIRSTSARRS